MEKIGYRSVAVARPINNALQQSTILQTKVGCIRRIYKPLPSVSNLEDELNGLIKALRSLQDTARVATPTDPSNLNDILDEYSRACEHFQSEFSSFSPTTWRDTYFILRTIDDSTPFLSVYKSTFELAVEALKAPMTANIPESSGEVVRTTIVKLRSLPSINNKMISSTNIAEKYANESLHDGVSCYTSGVLKCLRYCAHVAEIVGIDTNGLPVPKAVSQSSPRQLNTNGPSVIRTSGIGDSTQFFVSTDGTPFHVVNTGQEIGAQLQVAGHLSDASLRAILEDWMKQYQVHSGRE